jgi:hypothetical protein
VLAGYLFGYPFCFLFSLENNAGLFTLLAKNGVTGYFNALAVPHSSPFLWQKY